MSNSGPHSGRPFARSLFAPLHATTADASAQQLALCLHSHARMHARMHAYAHRGAQPKMPPGMDDAFELNLLPRWGATIGAGSAKMPPGMLERFDLLPPGEPTEGGWLASATSPPKMPPEMDDWFPRGLCFSAPSTALGGGYDTGGAGARAAA